MEVHCVRQQEKRSHKFIVYAVSLSVAGTPNASIGTIRSHGTKLRTAVSRKVVQQTRTRQCRKVLWLIGVFGP